MLNERIRQLREARGMTQVELARQLSVTKQSVSNWENNNIQPSVEMAVAIADFFGVTLDDLLGRAERRQLCVEGLTDDSAPERHCPRSARPISGSPNTAKHRTGRSLSLQETTRAVFCLFVSCGFFACSLFAYCLSSPIRTSTDFAICGFATLSHAVSSLR